MDFQSLLSWSAPSLDDVALALLINLTGIGLSAFGSALGTIFLFKPQSVSVSIIFLTVISYVGGVALEAIIPRKGFIGRWLNPHS